jgi:23S rRNA (adenine2503-C2)-methyltransferase
MLDPAVTRDPSQFVQLDASKPAEETSIPSPLRLKPLFGLDTQELAALMVDRGEPAWRGKQIAEAIYRQRVTNLSEITTLPNQLRLKLASEGWQVGRPHIAQVFQSVDGTERYLVQCGAETVETVWMPEGDGGESGDGTDSSEQEASSLGAPSCHPERAQRAEGPASCISSERVGDHKSPSTSGKPASTPNEARTRATICVSSQIGCAVNCQFCLTAKLGLQRNLTAGEIAGQVVAVLERHAVEVGRDRVNLVFMGMGEPFLNFSSFMAAVRLLVTEVGLSPRRMTVSTSGIVPGIERFAQQPVEFRPKLAISLNAPNNLIRQQLMPINHKWNIEAVMDAVRQVNLRPRERITFEYVLLGGVTDQPEHAHEVARLVRRTGLPVKVNLIAWNPGPGIAYSMPQPGAVEAFRATLTSEGIATYLRRPRGRDIYAACGQLKRTVEG